MYLRTRCITVYAVIIFWWNGVSNHTTLLLQSSNDDDYTTSDMDETSDVTSSNSTISDNYLNLDAPTSCQRRCNAYNQSKIFYAESTGGGLDDRIRLINAMTNLASFLCAELYILPPSDLLLPSHDNNTRVDEDLSWSDLLQATRFDGNNNVLHTRTLLSFHEEYESFRGLRIVTTNWKNTKRIIEDFQKIHKASFQNETFLWEIQINYWWMIRKQGGNLNNLGNIVNDFIQETEREDYIDMLPTESKFPSIDLSPSDVFLAGISRGCTYVKIEYSSPIKLLMQSLEREVRKHAGMINDDALIGLLHLRRGDTTHVCDTSIEKVRSYLKCSIGGSEGIRSVMLVMTSDEKDINYRNSILRLADEFIQLSVIDGDNITERIIDEAVATGMILHKSLANGFVAFAVESTLRNAQSGLIDFRLSRRRSNCPDCDPAIYRAIDPQTKYRFEGGILHMSSQNVNE